MIRQATLADVPRLVAMGREQVAAVYDGTVPDDPEQVEATVRSLLDGPHVATFDSERDGVVIGMIGLLRFVHPVTGLATVGEIMWWMDPAARGTGVQLLTRAEQWAADVGAVTLQMQAPTPRVEQLYVHRGYRRAEVTYTRAVTLTPHAVTVVDDVLDDVASYRTQCLAQPFGDVATAAGVFRGIAPVPDASLTAWLVGRWPQLLPTTTFLRRSPLDQSEPHLVHTDQDMGDWTALYYLTADPPAADGTTFYRSRLTGARRSVAETAEDRGLEAVLWADREAWEPWHTVQARPNRLVLFPAAYYHARAIPANYGTAETARLLQVTFGTGTVPGG